MYSITVWAFVDFYLKNCKDKGLFQNIFHSYKCLVNYAEHLCVKICAGIGIKCLLSDVSEY